MTSLLDLEYPHQQSGTTPAESTETTFSPFLPGTWTQVAWDSTSIDWFKRCPRLYQYCMIEGWRPKDESVHLRFGIELHAALHNYDKLRAGGMEYEDALQTVTRDLLIATVGWEPNNEYKNRTTLARSVIWYLDKYRPDPAETVIMGGGEPACEINFKFEVDFGPEAGASTEGLQIIEEREVEPRTVGGISWGSHEVVMQFPKGQPYILCGYLDRVCDFQGERFIMDRKTTKSTPGAYFFNQFEPNNQMTLYTLAGQVIFGTAIKGVIIDAIQVAVGFSRPIRSMTYRTKDQIDEWLGDLRYHLSNAETCARQEYWPQNDTSCEKYGGCTFREVCSKSPGVRDAYLKSNFVQSQPKDRWNPLRPRI